MTFKEFFFKKYVEWLAKQDGRKTVTEFADHLGVSQPSVSTWMNTDKVPKDPTIISNLAVRLGIEIYDILGLERPDERLFFITSHWEQLSEDEQRAILGDAEGFVSDETKKRKRRAA